MASTDVAFIIDSTNSLASTFGNSFYNAFYKKDQNIVNVSSSRLAAIYKPTLYFYINASVDPDTSVQGFYINCSSYTQLVQVLINSLLSSGLLPATDTGYIVKPSNSVLTDGSGSNGTTNYIQLYIGYSSNSSDTASLSGTNLTTIVNNLVNACFVSNTLTPVIDTSNLAVDPDFTSGQWTETLPAVGDYGSIGTTPINNQPINYLTVARGAARDSRTYFWGSMYTTDSESQQHTLVFSARPNSAITPTANVPSDYESSMPFYTVVTNSVTNASGNPYNSDMFFQLEVGIDTTPASSSNQPNTVTVLIGNTYSTISAQDGDFQTFSLDFYPKQIDPTHSDIAFNAVVYANPYLINELPFKLVVDGGRYLLSEELPFSLDVSSTYKLFFGLSAPCAVDIASVTIVKRGALLELDNPLTNYSVTPTYVDSSGNVVDPASVSSISPSVTQKATTSASTASSGGMSVLADINAVETTIMGYANSITSILGSIDKLATDFGIPFVDPLKQSVNYASLEKSLQDPTLSAEQKTKITAVMNTLKKVQRMQTTIATTEKGITDKINDVKKMIFGPVLKAKTEVGTELLKVTKEIDSLKAAAQGIQNGIQSQINGALTKLAASSAIGKLLSKSLVKYNPGVVKINFLTSSSLYTTINSVDSQIKAKDIQINVQTNQINTALTSPTSWQVNTASQKNGLNSSATQLKNLSNLL